MPRTPRTKIVATLGPSSAAYSVIRKMVRAGLDVVRLNFSHGTVDSHAECLEIVRRINRKYRRHIRVMQDLEGFRIRVGHFQRNEPKTLEQGHTVYLKQDEDDGEPTTVPLDYDGPLDKIEEGQEIFIDDGNLILKVKAVHSRSLRALVVQGGRLAERKGVNFPGVAFDFPSVTEKDARDIEFGIREKVDFVALSFVRNATDVKRMRERIQSDHPRCRIVAKIESREAIRNIDGIVEASDAVMIARGDMGIAVPVYRVPILQKQIIRACNRHRKPVITATQMLESMTENRRPTRAEVSDVANAILDGSDYLMLSSETAAGHYPVESVRMMNDIIKHTEAHSSEIA